MTDEEFDALLLTWGSSADTLVWREGLNGEELYLVAMWDIGLARASAILAAEANGEEPVWPPAENRWGTLEYVLLKLRLRYLRFDEYLSTLDEQTKEKYCLAMDQLEWAVSLIEKAKNGEFAQYARKRARQIEMGR